MMLTRKLFIVLAAVCLFWTASADNSWKGDNKGGHHGKNKKNCCFKPPKNCVRFKKCFHGCPAVVTCSTTNFILPVTNSTMSISVTSVSIPTSGVVPPAVVTSQTSQASASCTTCTVTVNPVSCTTVVVCNPARTSCPASFSTLTNMSISSTLTSSRTINITDPSIVIGAAAGSFEGSTLGMVLAAVVGSVLVLALAA